MTRTIEQQGHAWKALLDIAGESPTQLAFRGVNDRDVELWELKTRDGKIVLTGTEKDLLAALTRKEKDDATVD
jgi:hypothetical protein